MTNHSQAACRRRSTIFVVAAIAVAIAPGCVRRRLLVRSNPPGATVYVDNQPIGVTPCATSFVYYGTREIRLVKPGYETLTVNQPIPAPWYQIPGIDFVSENVVPKEIQDFRTVTYNLSPQAIVPTDQLLAKAQQLRDATQAGTAVPAGLTPTAPFAAPSLGPPMITPPPGASTLGPTLVNPQTPTTETLGPGVLVPPSSGSGALPPGGRPLEPLPAVQ